MQKQSVLICLYAYYPYENSNTNVMLPLISKLNEKYQVHILTQNRDNTAPSEEIMSDGVKVYRYQRLKSVKRLLHCIADMDMKKKRIWYKNLCVKMLTPLFRLLYHFDFFELPIYLLLKELISSNNYLFVLSTCESFDSHQAVLRLKERDGLNIPWIAYFMDPYSCFIARKNDKGELWEEEKRVYEKSDLVLVTEEIYEENKTNEFSPWLYKTKSFRFGNFRCYEMPLLHDIFVPNKINCVYVGSLLNESVRSPRYLYRLIDSVDDRFAFHIICNNMSKENWNLFDQMVQKKDRVCWHHNLPLDECLGIMSHADILINLGNKTVNQTPSKVFDYIGTGNPIVNIHSLPEDTSKRYLKRYPNALNITEDINLLKDHTESFEAFCSDRKGHKIQKSTLLDLYAEYESNRVTEATMQQIESLPGL